MKKDTCYVMTMVIPKSFEPCFKVGRVKNDCSDLLDDPKYFEEFSFLGKEIEEAERTGRQIDCSKFNPFDFVPLVSIEVDFSVWEEAKKISNDQTLDQKTKYLLAKKKFYSLLGL